MCSALSAKSKLGLNRVIIIITFVLQSGFRKCVMPGWATREICCWELEPSDEEDSTVFCAIYWELDHCSPSRLTQCFQSMWSDFIAGLSFRLWLKRWITSPCRYSLHLQGCQGCKAYFCIFYINPGLARCYYCHLPGSKWFFLFFQQFSFNRKHSFSPEHCPSKILRFDHSFNV